MPFWPLTDLRLLTQGASVPEILVVGEGVPARTLAEFIALAKAQPGRLVFASTGLGGRPHLATELLKISAGIELVHVPYTGAAPAVNDLLGGHVQMMFADIPVLLGAVQSGKLRALAIASRSRSPSVPDVATVAELGMPQVEADNWYGLVVAAGGRCEGAALGRGQGQALEPGRHRGGQLQRRVRRLVKSETERWGKVIATAGIKLK
jgi:tripartite-type tricarboxylate transporter receptor subunit TctC